MTAPVYVGGAFATGNSAAYNVSLTSLTGGVDAAAREDDLVIVCTGFYGTSDGDPGVSTAGFAEEADLYSDDTRDSNGAVCWKFMTSTPDTAVNCNGSGNAANGAATVVHVWRGVDKSTPLDVALVTSSGIDEARINTGAITPVTVDSIVISCGIGVSAANQGTLGAPSGYSNFVQGNVDPGMAAVALIASKVWAAGAENPPIFSGTWSTSTSDSWVGFTLALRPDSGAVSVILDLSATDETDVLSAAGLVNVVASLSVTDAADTLSATATGQVAAALSQTDATDTLSSVAIGQVVASFSQTDATDSLQSDVITGSVVIVSLTLTDATDTLSATVTVGQIVPITPNDLDRDHYREIADKILNGSVPYGDGADIYIRIGRRGLTNGTK